MTRRDLGVLAADKDIEHALRGLLSRYKSLPIRQIAFDIFVHPQHDAACAARGVPFLSPLTQRYQNALLILDHEGSGRETMSPDDLQAALNQEFRHPHGASAQGNRPGPGAGDLGLDSPHVDAVAGWAERRPRLRQWLNDHGLWNEQESKPSRQEAIQRCAMMDLPIAGILIGLFVIIGFFRQMDSFFHPDSGSLDGYALNVCLDSFVRSPYRVGHEHRQAILQDSSVSMRIPCRA